MRMTRSYAVVTPGYPRVGSNVIFVQAGSLPPGTFPSDNEVKNKGDAAIGMSRPASPSVNLLTSAGELASDGFPSPPDLLRWKTSLTSLRGIRKGVAKDYVAWNFGWKPLEREIRTYYKRVVEADNVIQRAHKASRFNVIRVGHSYPTATVSTATTGSLATYRYSDGFSFGFQASGGNWKQSYHRVWFEGKYLYFPPISKSAQGASHDFSNYAREVLGLELTPEVLWNLSPWSWFSDWLTNTDVVVQSVSDLLSDGMAMVEGFVMSHTMTESLTAASTTVGNSWSLPSSRSISETKKRFVSVPYLGFGGVGELTPRQLSILAALGVKH
jgi:hypothetical protein